MSSMTQQVKPIDSNPDYEHDFIHVLDEHPSKNHADTPFDDAINSAFARLQDIIAAKISVEAELDDLFTKRRAHALEELEKARRRLEFVDQEEKKMRNKIKGSSFGQPDDVVTPPKGSKFCESHAVQAAMTIQIVNTELIQPSEQDVDVVTTSSKENNRRPKTDKPLNGPDTAPTSSHGSNSKYTEMIIAATEKRRTEIRYAEWAKREAENAEAKALEWRNLALELKQSDDENTADSAKKEEEVASSLALSRRAFEKESIDAATRLTKLLSSLEQKQVLEIATMPS